MVVLSMQWSLPRVSSVLTQSAYWMFFCEGKFRSCVPGHGVTHASWVGRVGVKS